MDSNDDVMSALAAHDEAVDSFGRSIWVGAEPTYTDRSSEAPEWLFDALGDDKRNRAERMLACLARAEPGAVILRSVGRQYGGEPLPRWSLGLYSRRDGTPVWHGPPDPLLAGLQPSPNSLLKKGSDPSERSERVRPLSQQAAQPETLAAALTMVLQSFGLTAATLDAPLSARVVFRTDGATPPKNIEVEPLLARPALRGEPIEGAEVVDFLAVHGSYLVTCAEEDGVLRIELPGIGEVALFERLLDALSTAAREIKVPALVLSGYPPPVDETVAWMTVTPDPAVIEVNMAPVARVTDLLRRLRRLNEVAEEVGLASFRLQYNGMESDSGGGGHVTLGGARPASSPFLTVPSLLPSLVRYFNRHPSLSYLHTSKSVGPASQAPRVDESLRQALPELSLALELLKRVDDPTPETLWGTLAPFLADPSGNSHRAEINIEKLWNPLLGARGRNGLVEFRALRMGPAPETTAALAALMRAVVAMLAEHPCDEPLIDWGPTLHQRFSLPFYLHRDLEEVLADLKGAGLGLGASVVKDLLRERDLLMAERDLGASRLELRRALEFWPLVGDVATQERGGFRLIDSSTSRIELRLRSSRPDGLQDWTLAVGDWAIPLRDAEDENGAVRLAGLRYRSFVPPHGLHPTLGAQAPLALTLTHPHDGAWRVTLHEWQPKGQPYPGLPLSVAEARQRREERCVVESLEESPPPPVTQPPAEAVGECVVDLRWQRSA